jgi:hypothetical protein
MQVKSLASLGLSASRDITHQKNKSRSLTIKSQLRHSDSWCDVGTPNAQPPMMWTVSGRPQFTESCPVVPGHSAIARSGSSRCSETLPTLPIYHLHCWLRTPVSRLPQHARCN